MFVAPLADEPRGAPHFPHLGSSTSRASVPSELATASQQGMSTRFSGTRIARHDAMRIIAVHASGMIAHAIRGARTAGSWSPHLAHLAVAVAIAVASCP